MRKSSEVMGTNEGLRCVCLNDTEPKEYPKHCVTSAVKLKLVVQLPRKAVRTKIGKRTQSEGSLGYTASSA